MPKHLKRASIAKINHFITKLHALKVGYDNRNGRSKKSAIGHELDARSDGLKLVSSLFKLPILKIECENSADSLPQRRQVFIIRSTLRDEPCGWERRVEEVEAQPVGRGAVE